MKKTSDKNAWKRRSSLDLMDEKLNGNEDIEFIDII